MPDSSQRRPTGLWLQILMVGLVVGLIGGGYLVHLLTRPEALAAGTFVSGNHDVAPSHLARFSTPEGDVTVTVSVPMRKIPVSYGADEVRLAGDTRAVLIGVEGRGVERLTARGGLALIAGDQRYDLSPAIAGEQWLVLPGSARGLQVDLEWDGEHQGVHLASGKASRGIAAALARVGTPRVLACRVVAHDPAGRRHVAERSCPSLHLSEAVWLEDEGWVGDADVRWLDVQGLEFRDVLLDDGSEAWAMGTPRLRVDGEALRRVGDKGWRGQASGTSTRITVTSAAWRYSGGVRERGWRLSAELDLEALR